jgi:hypothetical protein
LHTHLSFDKQEDGRKEKGKNKRECEKEIIEHKIERIANRPGLNDF